MLTTVQAVTEKLSGGDYQIISTGELTALRRQEVLLGRLIHDLHHAFNYIQMDARSPRDRGDRMQYQRTLESIAAIAESSRRKLDFAAVAMRAVRQKFMNRVDKYELNALCEMAISSYLTDHWERSPNFAAAYGWRIKAVCNDAEFVTAVTKIFDLVSDITRARQDQVRITLVPDNEEESSVVNAIVRLFFSDTKIVDQLMLDLHNFAAGQQNKYFHVTVNKAESVTREIDLITTFTFEGKHHD